MLQKVVNGNPTGESLNLNGPTTDSASLEVALVIAVGPDHLDAHDVPLSLLKLST